MQRPRFQFVDYAPYQISMIAGLIRSELGVEMGRKFGLNVPEWRVMMTIGAFAPVTTKTISDYTTTSKPEISRAITRLVDENIIVRVVDPRDKRKVLLWFTKDGQDLYRELLSFAMDWEDGMFSVLSEDERAQFVDMLRRLRIHMVEKASEGPSDERGRVGPGHSVEMLME